MSVFNDKFLSTCIWEEEKMLKEKLENELIGKFWRKLISFEHQNYDDGLVATILAFKLQILKEAELLKLDRKYIDSMIARVNITFTKSCP